MRNENICLSKRQMFELFIRKNKKNPYLQRNGIEIIELDIFGIISTIEPGK